jgi:ABC-type Zn uptake system ZnuABC Zn-binding protein ZnuA
MKLERTMGTFEDSPTSGSGLMKMDASMVNAIAKSFHKMFTNKDQGVYANVEDLIKELEYENADSKLKFRGKELRKILTMMVGEYMELEEKTLAKYLDSLKKRYQG